jgi:hypothetical protein
MTTISASSTIGIVLSSPSYANPVVINPGVAISNGGDGVYATTGSWTVQNAGSIASTGTVGIGVGLGGGGSVTNATSAFITGHYGVEIGGSAGSVVNGGIIEGGSSGVDLRAGGSVANAASADITGALIGVWIGSGAGTVVNDYRISGIFLAGVSLGSGGSVTNATSAFITGYYGVEIGGSAGSVVNDGTIIGAIFDGVYLRSGGSVTNAASGSITGASFGVDLPAGGTLTNAGTIGGGTLGEAVTFGGTGTNRLVLDPGYGFSGLVSGSTSASNTLELASAASSGAVSGLGTEFVNFGPIVFDAGAEWSIAGNTAGLAGTISGFALGDTIEVTGVTATGSSFVGGVLTLHESVGSATLDLPGTFSSAANFNVANNAQGTEVTVACFAAGTRVLTVAGEVVVEALAPGDVLGTMSGRLRRVRWIGYRRIELARHAKPQDVLPVRVQAHAFGPGVPYGDLLVSPDHALFLDGVLIPARYLINGATVRQEAVEEVEYYHVELDLHDVLLAEGLPCESYLDTGNRAAFANGRDEVMLHPDFALKVWETKACAELVVNGPRLEAAKGLLLARAETLGHRVTNDPSLSVMVDGRHLSAEVCGSMWRVSVPLDAQTVRLLSRACVPAHVLPNNDDTRPLGVAIANVRFDGRALPLDDPRLLSGWHTPESQWRWTDGDAGLRVADARELAFDVVITGSYWEAPSAADKARVGQPR